MPQCAVRRVVPRGAARDTASRFDVGLAHAIANGLAHLHLTLFLYALLERIHNVDDLRRRLALRFDGHFRRALFDLSAEILMHGNRVLVWHRLGLKLS